MKSKIVVGSLIVFSTVTGLSVAQEEEFDPEPVIEGRQAGLRDIGGAFKGINDELKASQPSLPLIRQYARQIEDLAAQQKFWFPPGTGPETEIETKAKPEIWTNNAQFKQGQAAMSEQAAQLSKVSAGDDVAAIRKQWQALGKTCKGCHDSFREKED